MTSLERRLLSRSVFLGTLLTLAVVLADRAGLLSHLENWFYDHRAQVFQNFMPPPTDQLLHLDIDDRSLEAIGHWPWPRAKLATIMDEIHRAGPKTVELDVIFPEPQLPRIVKRDDGSYVQIDDDALFAASLKKLGNAILGASFFFGPPKLSPLEQAMRRELETDLELEPQQAIAKVSADHPEAAGSNQVHDQFIKVRRFVIRNKLSELLDKGPLTLDQAIATIIKKQDVNVATPLRKSIEEQYGVVTANRAMRRFSVDPSVASKVPILTARFNLPPVPVLSEAAVSSAFVDQMFSADGVVRSLPMLVECEGRLYPQLGFDLACRMLDVPLSSVRVEADRIILPTPRGDRVVPVTTRYRPDYGQNVGTIFDVPFFGTSVWESMYDWPDHRVSKQHLSIIDVWDIQMTREKIVTNNRQIDDAIKSFFGFLAPEKLDRYLKSPPAADDSQTRNQMIDREMAEAQEIIDAYESMQKNGEALDVEGKHFMTGIDALRKTRAQSEQLTAQLASQQQKLAERMKGKAVLVGWIATGAADLVSTSVHATCPGVVVHGAVFNAIMTGEMWYRLPWWMTAAATGLLGVSMAFGAGRFSPVRGLALAIALAWGYLLVNGVVLFDLNNLIMGMAAPTIAVALVWAICTLQRIMLEQRERKRIESRFKNYVDPKLVDYVTQNDLSMGFDGEVREMTVVFTDLVGFTSLSEKLQERTVPMLSEFLEMMVPVIRDTHQAYLNKFLGDGIMFFYGAPREHRDHAGAAVATVLDMQAKLVEFNRTLVDRGLPNIGMRAGISTGNMVVGDIGGAGSVDYTVLGDVVNLGARLESANKATGTKIMISEKTHAQLNGRYLTRPLGRLQVAGKVQGVLTYEVICRTEHATDEQKKLVELTTCVVESFRTLELPACMAAVEEIDRLFGVSPLTRLYRELCRQYTENPPAMPFDGKIVLTEK